MAAALINSWARIYSDGEFWICVRIQLDLEGKADIKGEDK
jgi:hypothetical protein